MGKQVSIRVQIDEETKRDFDLLLKLKEESISDNLRAAIASQLEEHRDLIQSIRERFEATKETKSDGES